jgi:DNA-binding response OmpR family regulator
MRDILVAEDNALLAKGICTALKSERYRVRHVADGAAALAAVAERRPDVLVLDIMMPKMDGITVCRTIRRTDAHLPILMLTARGLDSQKVEGLSAGADDYLTKPFSIAELLARIAALLRRALLAAPQSAADTFAFGAATVDASTLTVTASDGTSQRLLPRELRLLKLFAENPGKVFSRDELLDRFWGVSYYGTTRTLDQRLMLLRKKLGSDATRIESVHGVGYKYVPAGGS